MDKKGSSGSSKSKSKSKQKKLKPNKESSTQLDVDLWEVSTKIFTKFLKSSYHIRLASKMLDISFDKSVLLDA